MPNPIPGRQYTARQGDTLSGIAARAYGDPNEWPRIFSANQSALKSGSPDLIYPGEIINIPVIPELEEIKSRFFESQGVSDGVELKIEDRIIPVQSANVIRTMDTFADAWTARFAWNPGLDQRIDELTAPYAFPKATISLDGQLMITGRIYRVKQERTDKGRIKELHGFSHTIDAVDSTLRPPYEANNITIVQRAEALLTPLGIRLEVAAGVDTGGQFSRVTTTPTKKIFDHLHDLAKQRSVLLTSTPAGVALMTTANILSPIAPVGTLEEGVSFVADWEGDFDGRKLFNVYRAIGQGANKTEQKVGIAKDDNVPLSRFMTFIVDDSLKGEMNQAAVWRRNQTAAKALKIPIKVDSWYGPDGKLWQENTKLTLKSLTLDIPAGFTFLIRQASFGWSPAGKSTILNVLPISFYESGDLTSPW